MSYLKMQDAASHLEKRISPDITCIPFTFTGNAPPTTTSKHSHGVNGSTSTSTSSPPPRGTAEGISSSSYSSSESSLNNSNSGGSGSGSGGSPTTTSNNLSALQNMTAIAEVPVGLYEFVLGEAGDVRILCKVCQYISNKKSNFKRHFTNMHFVHNEETSKQLECCGIRFSTKGDKFQHTKSVHKFGYKCFICLKVFDRPALLQRHLAKHTGKKPYKCSLCTYQTPNKANAKRHIEKKHSDVQEGSILFVTEDGEQIHMEVVSKSGKGVVDLSNSSNNVNINSTPPSVSCGGGMNMNTACYMTMTTPPIPIMPPSYFNLLQSRPSATVTSSSASSSENAIGGRGGDPFFSSMFGMNIFNSDMSSSMTIDGKKKRHISHSIEKIIKDEGIQTGTGNQAFSAPIIKEEAKVGSVPSYLLNLNHHHQHPPAMNQSGGEFHWYCPPDWSRSSSTSTGTLSLLPFNTSRDYNIGLGYHHQSSAPYHPHPHGIVSAFRPPPTTSSSNQGSSSLPSFVFHQCIHGCWHSVLNNQSQSTSVFSQSSPDLRFACGFSQQPGGFFKNDRDDGEEEEIIDVVGEDEDDDIDEEEEEEEDEEEDEICEGFVGSCTTSTKEENNNGGMMGEVEIGFGTRPPVGSSHPMELSGRSSSVNNNSARDDRDGEDVVDGQNEEGDDEITYIPKKLRVSRAYCK